MIKRQWWLLWAAVLVAGCGDGGIQSPDFTTQLLSISVTPASAPAELGSTVQFTATGTYTAAPGSGASTEVRPLDSVAWSVSDTARAEITETGLATARAVGTVTVFARQDGVEGTATLSITAPDLLEVRIRANPESSAPLPLNASRQYIAEGIYTNSDRDAAGNPIPEPIAGTVSWTSSNPGVATVDPATGASTTATAVATGETTITASSPNNAGQAITDEVTLTVEAAAINGLIRVEPAVTSVAVGNTTPFVAIAEFSNGNEDQLANNQIDWSSSAPAVATVNASGVATGVSAGGSTITAALKPGVTSNTAQRSATAQLTVIQPGVDCSVPLNAASGASVSAQIGLLCILCVVDDEGNVIDSNPANFANVNVPVGLLLATASLRVTAPPGPAIPAGQDAGMVIGRPAGMLAPLGAVATAELLSQLTLRTLLDGVATVDSSGPSNLLRLSLLGTAVIDGTPPQEIDQVLVSVPTTANYNQIELEFSSGVVSAFAETYVYSAVCGDLSAPAP